MMLFLISYVAAYFFSFYSNQMQAKRITFYFFFNFRNFAISVQATPYSGPNDFMIDGVIPEQYVRQSCPQIVT